MRRRLHKLFPWLHRFEPYELTDSVEPGREIIPNPFNVRVWYIGFRCAKCKATGYKVPLGR